MTAKDRRCTGAPPTRRTFVLLGSSGAGKSTLVNRLAGRRLMPTGDLRRDGRGRHTTRHRRLLVLPGGALLVDTPGLRELGLGRRCRQRILGHRRARDAVPLQRLRALRASRGCAGAGRSRKRGPRIRSATRAIASSSESSARSSCARAHGCVARPSSVGGSAPAKAGQHGVTARGRRARPAAP